MSKETKRPTLEEILKVAEFEYDENGAVICVGLSTDLIGFHHGDHIGTHRGDHMGDHWGDHKGHHIGKHVGVHEGDHIGKHVRAE